MTTSFAQSTIYFPPNSNEDLIPQFDNQNVSGLGTSQTITFVTAVPLTAGVVIGIPFQVSRPPPLLYFATAFAGDKLTIQSPDGLIISPSSFISSVGSNGVYFQPSAGGTYLLYYTASTVMLANAVCAYVQSVLENTVGQYIDMGSVAYSEDINKLPNPPQVSQIIAANTTSAVPNTFVVDFVKFPVKKGLNILATYRVMVSAAGMEQFGKDFLNTVGANAKTVTIVAGQAMAIQWYSTESCFLNARYSLTITGAGQVALPATVGMTSISSMYPALLGNQANITSYTDMAVERASGPQLDVAVLCENIGSKTGMLQAEFNALKERNERAHERIFGQLAEIMRAIRLDREDDRQSSVLGHIN